MLLLNAAAAARGRRRHHPRATCRGLASAPPHLPLPPPPPPPRGRRPPRVTRSSAATAAAAATTVVGGVASTMASSVASAGAWPRRPRSARRGFRARYAEPASTRGARSARPTAAAAGRARRWLGPPRGAVVALSEPPPPSVTRPLPRPTRGARRPHMPTASPPRRLAWGRPFTRGGGRSLGRAIMAGVSPQWPVVGGPTRPTERATDPPARPAGPRGSLGESPRQGAVGLVYYSARTPHFPGRRAMGPSLTN